MYETIAVLCKTQAEAEYVGDKILENIRETEDDEESFKVTVLNKKMCIRDRFSSGLIRVWHSRHLNTHIGRTVQLL